MSMIPTVGADGVVEDTCHIANTVAEAADICHAADARMCSADEIGNKVGKGTGCALDEAKVWTSTPCDGGYIAYKGSGSGPNTLSECLSEEELRGVRCCADKTIPEKVYRPNSLAQALFEVYQAAVVANAPKDSLAFPPAASDDHFTTLVQHFNSNLHGAHAGRVTINDADLAMEWAESDTVEIVVVPPPPPMTIAEFNKINLNKSGTPGSSSYGAVGDGLDGSPLVSVFDASTIDGTQASKTGAARTDDQSMSSGVLAFAIVVPIFLIGIGAFVYHQHRSHRKVQVMPSGLNFKQPAGVQALPSRGVPGYPDRTMDDVRSPQIASMPQAPMLNVNPGPESTFEKPTMDDPFA